MYLPLPQFCRQKPPIGQLHRVTHMGGVVVACGVEADGRSYISGRRGLHDRTPVELRGDSWYGWQLADGDRLKGVDVVVPVVPGDDNEQVVVLERRQVTSARVARQLPS